MSKVRGEARSYQPPSCRDESAARYFPYALTLEISCARRAAVKSARGQFVT